MEPQQNQPDPRTRVSNSLAVTQTGEQVLFTIRRHPIGILGMYVAGGMLLIASAVVCFVAPMHLSGDVTQFKHYGALAFLLVLLAAMVFLFISTIVYWGNSWVLTSDSITQIQQTSLFNRQSSQLSLGNLEDVTAEQNGILTHIFNYGLLKVETAGEHSKFSFFYCPNPNFYAQQVIAAREAFEQKVGDGNRDTYLNTHAAPTNVPYAQDQPPAGPPPQA